jgi:hypothetical protein
MRSSVYRTQLIAFSLLMAGCAASKRDDSEGRFVINEHRYDGVGATRLAAMRSAWKEQNEATMSRSVIAPRDQKWALDFIARLESNVVSRCQSLELSDVTQLPPVPFRVITTEGKPLRYYPTGHLEQWTVNACGTSRRWRLFNELTDPSNPFRVLLWDVN